MTDALVTEVLAAHRAFYDAVETGDVDLMASLWVDDPGTSCVHPGAVPVRGTAAVLRSWTLLMANVGYIQFFLTDVDVVPLPPGVEGARAVAVTCTENILADAGSDASAETFAGGRAICTSILVRGDGPGPAPWRFWSRHASPVAEITEEP